MEHDPVITRAWVLHPDLKSDRGRRNPEPALAEAVSLAGALRNIEVCGGEIVPLPKTRAGTRLGPGKIHSLNARIEAKHVELDLTNGNVS